MHVLIAADKGDLIPQIFAEHFTDWGLTAEQASYLLEGPTCPYYEETWSCVLREARFTNSKGVTHHLVIDDNGNLCFEEINGVLHN